MKFAKLRPSPEACGDSLDAARAVVDRTRPREDHLDGGVGFDDGAGFGEPDSADDARVFAHTEGG